MSASEQVTTGDVSFGTASDPIPPSIVQGHQTAPTILVVDGDGRQRASVLRILRRAGYQVTGVDSFHAARQFLASTQPDLLIADVRLGAFNGLHLVWQRHAAHPGQPSIVTHAVADAVLQRDAFTFGAPYLVKPISPLVLLSAVDALLPRECGWAAAALAERHMPSAHGEGRGPSPRRIHAAYRARVKRVDPDGHGASPVGRGRNGAWCEPR